jgi:hypothetical protein
MDLKTLKKILKILIDDKILTSELINFTSIIYENEDTLVRNVYVRYDLNNKKYVRDRREIDKAIDYLIKAYEKELIYTHSIVIFDQVEEEGGTIKRYVGFEYPIQHIANKKRGSLYIL